MLGFEIFAMVLINAPGSFSSGDTVVMAGDGYLGQCRLAQMWE
jgi:hypothetical protein